MVNSFEKEDFLVPPEGVVGSVTRVVLAVSMCNPAASAQVSDVKRVDLYGKRRIMKRLANVKVVLAVMCVLAAAFAFISPASGTTQPTVDGWVISWADDGWYQVQTGDGSTEVCQGDRSCDVKAEGHSAGEYLVINLTTGKRYPLVTVPSGGSTDSDATDSKDLYGPKDSDGSKVVKPLSASAAPTVTGWVIKWSDNGWYQVQTKDGSKTLCNGGPSCDVRAQGGDSGYYKVINHTTGDVWPEVKVIGGNYNDDNPPTDDGAPWIWDSTSSVGVSWPHNSDYYQVQDLNKGYATVPGCEGATVSTCSAPISGGIYRWQVVNITKNKSWPVTIGSHQASAPIAFENSIISTNNSLHSVKDSSGKTVCNMLGIRKSCDVGKGTYKVENRAHGQSFTVTVTGPTGISNTKMAKINGVQIPVGTSAYGGVLMFDNLADFEKATGFRDSNGGGGSGGGTGFNGGDQSFNAGALNLADFTPGEHVYLGVAPGQSPEEATKNGTVFAYRYTVNGFGEIPDKPDRYYAQGKGMTEAEFRAYQDEALKDTLEIAKAPLGLFAALITPGGWIRKMLIALDAVSPLPSGPATTTGGSDTSSPDTNTSEPCSDNDCQTTTGHSGTSPVDTGCNGDNDCSAGTYTTGQTNGTMGTHGTSGGSSTDGDDDTGDTDDGTAGQTGPSSGSGESSSPDDTGGTSDDTDDDDDTGTSATDNSSTCHGPFC